MPGPPREDHETRGHRRQDGTRPTNPTQTSSERRHQHAIIYQLSLPTDDDTFLPLRTHAQPEDESRQFLRLNMIKRLMARLRDGLETPGNLDAGEKLAWAAQLEFLEEEVAAAVEKVTGMAHERDPPTPKHGTQNTAVSAPNSAPANESLGAMFAGMDVGGATPQMGPTAVPGNVLTPSPLPSGGIAGGDLFSGLDLTPGAAEATLPVRPSPGGVAGLGMLDESLFGGALVAEVPPAPEPSVEEKTDERCFGSDSRG